MALGFSDPRMNLQITDGIRWVQEIDEGTYDAIIVDSSDPVGPAEVLFQEVQKTPSTWGFHRQSDRPSCPVHVVSCLYLSDS